jgi:hypothetical protein
MHLPCLISKLTIPRPLIMLRKNFDSKRSMIASETIRPKKMSIEVRCSDSEVELMATDYQTGNGEKGISNVRLSSPS